MPEPNRSRGLSAADFHTLRLPPLAALFCILVFILSSAARPAKAQQDFSFSVQNQQPLAMLYGLPRLHEADIIDEDKSRWEWSFDISNNFTGSDNANEFIFLDGESIRLGLRYRHGFANGWEAGVDIPLLRHGGGFLDNVVIEFHDLFGFGQLGRDRVARDLLNYRYIVSGERLIDLTEPVTGLGDVRLLLGRRLDTSAANSVTSIRAHLKLPTGDSDRLLGSSGVDGYLGINRSQQLTDNWHWSLTGGINYLGNGDVLPSQQKNWAFSGSTGLSWHVWKRVSLRAQWDAHSQLFDNSELGQLKNPAFVLSMGGRINLGDWGYLDLAITENAPNPEASPDVGFYFQWHKKD